MTFGMIDPIDVTKGSISVIVGSKLNLLWESQMNGLSHKTLHEKTQKCINIDIASRTLLIVDNNRENESWRVHVCINPPSLFEDTGQTPVHAYFNGNLGGFHVEKFCWVPPFHVAQSKEQHA